MICVALKDGQLRIAKLGKPYFPEPFSQKTILVKENEELFLTGVYLEYNTEVMSCDKYKKIVEENKTYHPTLVFWKINTLFFLCLSFVFGGICLYQRGMFMRVCEFSKEIKKFIR